MAQTQLFLGKQQVFLVEEATQDTFETPAAGDNFLAENVTVTFDQSPYSPAYARGDFFQGDEVPGATSVKVAFRIPIAASGTGATTPHWSEVLKACGMRASTGAGTVTYKPLSVFDSSGGNPGSSYSFGVLLDGKIRYAGYGGFGNAKFSASADSVGFIEVEMMGAYEAVTSASPGAADLLAVSGYDTTVPPAFRGASASVNFGSAYTLKGLRSFELDLGNQISMGVDANESAGYYGARITGRKSTGSFSVDMVGVGTHDWFGIQQAGTAGSFTTGTIGATAGNQWNVTIGRIVMRIPSLEEIEGKQGVTIPFAVGSIPTDVEGTANEIRFILT